MRSKRPHQEDRGQKSDCQNFKVSPLVTDLISENNEGLRGFRAPQSAKSPQKGQRKLSFLLLYFKRGRRSRPEPSEARRKKPLPGGEGLGWGEHGGVWGTMQWCPTLAERSEAKQQCSRKKRFVPHSKGNTGAHDSMNSTPIPAAPLVKRYIKFPQERKFDMLFQADPHPRRSLSGLIAERSPLPLLGGGGSDFRKTFLTELRNQKRKIARV